MSCRRLLFCAMFACASADPGVIRQLSDLDGKPYTVGYNSRSMLLNGRPVLLLSGSVHYVRSTPEMWPSIFAKMKAAGLNAVESYVFWNYHVPTLDTYNNKTADYTGRGNVTYFLDLAAAYDLFVIWRIGPYICAEWPGGGMPSWLGQIPGMHPRSATQPYQDVCFDWMHSHIEYVRPYFAENGGPIIMTQMENELSGPSNTPYVDWLGELATQLKTNLPWIMCHGAHANDTIETCNGCDCTDFVDGIVVNGQPAMWTEDEQWFDRFSQGASVRPTGNVGRAVAAFIAAGGSLHNFYMFHGGTMWGNWSTTVRRTRLTPSYANTANLASDSTIYDPKYTTIAALHHVLVNFTSTIMRTPVPIVRTSFSPTTWGVTLNGTSGDPPISFLFNDGVNTTTINFNGDVFEMAPESSRILDAARNVLWYSDPGVPDGLGLPYLPAVPPGSLAWTSWSDNTNRGTWYRTTFPRPLMPPTGLMSVNLTGFGQGNMFLNGVHVTFFDLAYGECFHPPGGVNNHGSCLTYLRQLCDKPTQSTYHVPPEWIADQNEMLIFSSDTLPSNVTRVDPSLASVVYRVDPPSLLRKLEPIHLCAQNRLQRSRKS